MGHQPDGSLSSDGKRLAADETEYLGEGGVSSMKEGWGPGNDGQAGPGGWSREGRPSHEGRRGQAGGWGQAHGRGQRRGLSQLGGQGTARGWGKNPKGLNNTTFGQKGWGLGGGGGKGGAFAAAQFGGTGHAGRSAFASGGLAQVSTDSFLYMCAFYFVC